MAKAAKPKKATTTHPRTGSQFKIAAEIYAPFKAAILQSLKGSKGKSFTELTVDVTKIIRKKIPVPVAIGIKKSIPWYTISIRLDLETRGIVETFTEKGKKLNRLSPRTLKG
jgi:ABC-type microcin C transport system permease subunit YejB